MSTDDVVGYLLDNYWMESGYSTYGHLPGRYHQKPVIMAVSGLTGEKNLTYFVPKIPFKVAAYT